LETHEFAVCTLDKSRIGKVASRDTGKTTSVATRENQSKFPVPGTTLTHRGARVWHPYPQHSATSAPKINEMLFINFLPQDCEPHHQK
jgi:hypothetical protein